MRIYASFILAVFMIASVAINGDGAQFTLNDTGEVRGAESPVAWYPYDHYADSNLVVLELEPVDVVNTEDKRFYLTYNCSTSSMDTLWDTDSLTFSSGGKGWLWIVPTYGKASGFREQILGDSIVYKSSVTLPLCDYTCILRVDSLRSAASDVSPWNGFYVWFKYTVPGYEATIYECDNDGIPTSKKLEMNREYRLNRSHMILKDCP